MISLFEALVEVDSDLRDLGVKWALLGGLAVSLRAEPRTTKDLDLAIATHSNRETESLVADLKARRYAMLQEPFERTDMDRVSTVRMVGALSSGRMVVDLLFASSGIEPEIVESAEYLEVLPGIALPVITMGHLLAVKIYAGRNKDLVDVDSLLRFASEADVRIARSALDLILRRTPSETRDLQHELNEILNRFSESD